MENRCGVDEKEPAPMINIRQKIGVFGFLAVFLNLILWIVFGDNGFMELSGLKEKKQLAVRRNETLADENVHLYRIIQRLKHDPAYIESVARNELGMVGKNDLVIVEPQNK